MLILGIETSCDETAASVVKDGTVVLSNVIASSQGEFQRTGGVIPEEAARRQLECIGPVIRDALQQADCTMQTIDAIAVTHAPGLLGSLLVGTITARTMSRVHGTPLIPVHHTLGHLSSTWLQDEQSPVPNPNSPIPNPQFPILTLSVSGGHTELWLRTAHTNGEQLGHTRDDAAGEAFDKGAQLLGLPYPGGPAIAEAAKAGNPHAFEFPLPLRGEDTFDWSFSGLKTSLLYAIRDHAEMPAHDLAASYQHALCRHLVAPLARAIERHPEIREVHLVGGVSANLTLRDMVRDACGERIVRWPTSMAYCTDNAAMIAAAGYFLQHECPAAVNAPFETTAKHLLPFPPCKSF